MPRKKHVQLVGKRAAFDVEVWARAVLALAEQLHREQKATGQWPPVDEEDDDPKQGREKP